VPQPTREPAAQVVDARRVVECELARRLGASREKVNRKLREWSASGWVETTPAGLRILGETRLRALFSGRRCPPSLAWLALPQGKLYALADGTDDEVEASHLEQAQEDRKSVV
jgi:DNA-binding GntR family transcriptional regulator